jgi:predicted  nucleic acid-binding Zn-ribbon protein
MKVNREGYRTDGVHRECTNCGDIFKIKSKTVVLCNKCNSNRVKSQPLEKKMWRRAKQRASERNLDFNIELIDIVIPTHCPILGIELKEHKGRSGGEKNSPALDRLDNSKGYIKGNVVVISHLANMMKSSANNSELLTFAKWITVNIPAERNELC